MGTTYLGNIRGPQGNTGLRGPQGLPGAEAIPTDAAVAGYIATEGSSATKTALGTRVTRTTRDALIAGLGLYLPPDGMPSFSRLPMPQIRYHAATRRFSASVDYGYLIPKGGVTYYVSPDAPGTGNSGLNESSPITIRNAIEKPDVGEIRYAAGTYFWNTHGWNGQTLTRAIRHIGSTQGRTRVTGWGDPALLTWTLNGGSVYKTTRAATTKVVDVDNLTATGDYTQYEKRADVASMTAPGQWATVSGVVYVWPIGNTDMTTAAGRSQVRLQVTIRSGIITAGPTQYVENIDFEGNANTNAVAGSGDAVIILKDCKIKYATYGVALTGGAVILERVEVAVTSTDAISYHSTTGTSRVEFMEIDCNVRNAGTPGVSNDNASTAHETTIGIRVNGTYRSTYGPVIADVGSTRTWLLGCDAGDSLNTVDAGNSAFHCDGVGAAAGAAAVMFVDRVTARNAKFGLLAPSNGTIYKTTVENVAVVTAESGSVITYQP